MRRPPPELLALAAIVGFVGAFCVVPAVELLGRASATAGGLAGVARVVALGPNRLAFENSAVQGALSAALAVAVGYPAGVFLGRYRFPGRRAVRSALLLPFLLPALVMVVGIVDLFGPGGLVGGPFAPSRWLATGVPGIVAVNLLYNVPIVVVLTAAGVEASSAPLEETVASLGGGPWRAYRDVWAGPSLAGAACGALLTFVFSALSFAPPILLCGNRCATVEVRVYTLSAVLGQSTAAGALALALVAAFAVPSVAYVVVVRRLRARRGRSPRPRAPAWRAPVTWALAAAFGAVVVAELSLVAAVVVRSVVPYGGAPIGRGWSLLFDGTTAARLGISVEGATGNTLFFAGLAAALGLVVGVTAAFVTRRRPRLGLPVGLLLFVPVLLSPVVLASALASLWQPVLGGTADVWVLVVLSQSLLGLPFVLQSLEIPLAGVPRGPGEAARSVGAGPWTAFVDAELPRLRAGVRTAVLFAFALGLGEFTATNFLVTPRFVTLPVAVYALTDDRLFAAAGAAAALLLALSAVLFTLVVLGGSDDER